MKIQFIFKWYDFWVGFFYDQKKNWLYFFPLPMVGIILKFTIKWKPSKCTHEWKQLPNRIPLITPSPFMHCIKCGMYVGGVDSFNEQLKRKWKKKSVI